MGNRKGDGAMKTQKNVLDKQDIEVTRMWKDLTLHSISATTNKKSNTLNIIPPVRSGEVECRSNLSYIGR